MISNPDTDADVIIVGYGPVGASLAALLGRRGIRTIVVERDVDVYPLPRAAHIDHQGLRLLQGLGILDDLIPTMLQNTGIEFVTADRQTLIKIPAGNDSISGLPASMYFHQPSFDRSLRGAASALETVDVRLGCELAGILLSPDRASVTVSTQDGKLETLTALFVVGCDGAWSPTRETAGMRLGSLQFDERWLVLDLLLREGVEVLSNRAVTVCDPARPCTAIPIPGHRFRLEHQLFPEEDSAEMQDPAVVDKLVADWAPPGSASLERAAVYRFHGLVAEPWRSGRTLVAGDAAHQMPPFLGQGMCSGLRDAANLAWKLAHVIQLGAPMALLDTYEAERSPHVRAIVESAVRYGRLTCITDEAEAAARNERWLADPRGATKRLPFRLPSLSSSPVILDGGGELFIQTREGDTWLDTVVGDRFLVLADSSSALGSSADWWVTRVGAMVATVDSLPGSDALNEWLRSRGANVVVVRPDHYVLATGRNLDDFAAAEELLCASDAARVLVSH